MIAAQIVVEPGIDVPSSSALQPKVHVNNYGGGNTKIGERNIIEELSVISGSVLGDGNLIEVGSAVRNSTIGNNNIIGIKCEVVNSTIGNNCAIMTTVKLKDVSIPDNTCVYLSEGKWRCRPVDLSMQASIIEAYREKLTSSESPQCLSKNFK